MKANLMKAISLIPQITLTDIFLKNQEPGAVLMKELEKVIEPLHKSWRGVGLREALQLF